MSAIKLGQRVRDIVSGFNGIAISRLDQLNGNVQYAVQPMQKDGETAYPEAMYIDHHMLEVLDEGVSDKVTKPVFLPLKLRTLGAEVRDTITDFTGIATQKATYMNGCVSFDVVSKNKKKGGALCSWFDHSRLEVIGAGAQAIAAEPSADKPGGPSQRVQRQAVR